MNHLTEVAELVAQATDGDVDIVIAAILHDTVEDTGVSNQELKDAFGDAIAGLVAEVTDDKSLPKQTRKDRQVEHAPHASWGAQIIKLADQGDLHLQIAAREPAAGLVARPAGRICRLGAPRRSRLP